MRIQYIKNLANHLYGGYGGFGGFGGFGFYTCGETSFAQFRRFHLWAGFGFARNIKIKPLIN
jgi:hypothetical protein